MTNTLNSLTEKDMLQDILTLEKDIVKTYASYLTETSCENLRELLNNNLEDAADGQFQVFSCMTSRNMYPVKEAPAPEVMQAKKTFGEMSAQF